MLLALGNTALFCTCLIAFCFLTLSEIERYLKDRTSISMSTEKNLVPYVPSFTICHSKPFKKIKDVAKMMELNEYELNTYNCDETFTTCSKYALSVRTVYSGKCFTYTRKERTSSNWIGTAQLVTKADFKIFFHRSYKMNEIMYNQIYIKSSNNMFKCPEIDR